MVDLEQALTDLAGSLEFPREAALAERVAAQLTAPAVVVPLVRRPAVRRVLAVVAAAVVIVGLVLVGSPRARRAVADLLGIGGIEIQSTPPTTAGTTAATAAVAGSTSLAPTSAPPTFPPTAAAGSLDLGSPIDLDQGSARVGVVPPVPAALGPPTAVFYGSPPPAGQLSLLWPPSPTLPATRIPEFGALLTVFRASIDEGYFLKVLDPSTTYERVTVGGQPAAWLAGEPHTFLYQTADGEVRDEAIRLAGNTLIWTAGPFTYRLESALDRAGAIAVAESVPVG